MSSYAKFLEERKREAAERAFRSKVDSSVEGMGLQLKEQQVQGTPLSQAKTQQPTGIGLKGKDVKGKGKAPAGKGMSANAAAGLMIAGGIAGSEIQEGSPYSSSAGAIGGALSGAASGAAIGSIFGGPGVGTAIGAVGGALMGRSKAKAAKRAALAQIESDKHIAQAQILGEKGRRIDSALSGLRQAFSAALLSNKDVRLS